MGAAHTRRVIALPGPALKRLPPRRDITRDDETVPGEISSSPRGETALKTHRRGTATAPPWARRDTPHGREPGPVDRRASNTPARATGSAPQAGLPRVGGRCTPRERSGKLRFQEGGLPGAPEKQAGPGETRGCSVATTRPLEGKESWPGPLGGSVVAATRPRPS